MDELLAELTNLANGLADSGDWLAGSFCLEAVKEIKRLRDDNQIQRNALEEIYEAVGGDRLPSLEKLVERIESLATKAAGGKG